ncbi:MAG: VCBS repeat-containing protein [candidate division Zixibacteria bacterium]|nr:VCBS repeat-containing protein [candidate division Zixibacteria bacterium]
MIFLVACNGNEQATTTEEASGEELAKIFCASCHKFSEPALFTKSTWADKILPLMGPRLGIYSYKGIDYKYEKEDTFIKGWNVYPDEAMVSEAEWIRILEYYNQQAPINAPAPPEKQAITIGLKHFKTVIPPRLKAEAPMISLVKLDQLTSNLFVADGNQGILYIINPQNEVINTLQLGNIPIHLRFDAGVSTDQRGMWITPMGSMRPTNAQTGLLRYMYFNQKVDIYEPQYTIKKDLRRPVHSAFGDLNNDGKEDIVISEFGYLIGELNCYENLGGFDLKKHTLRKQPGAIMTYIYDFDGDGLKDVIALMSQGDEGIYIYYNQGNFEFKEEQILRFEASYGSSGFELADFNGDGYFDILYTNGDDGDGIRVLKYYHGVRIFLNDKTNHFQETFFYPLHGAYKAIAWDYDLDGDLDIASVSFFADYKNAPEEGFVYFENIGNMKFKPYTFNEVEIGRWMTFDKGDIDKDGDVDLILANFSIGPREEDQKFIKKWVNEGPDYLILENTIR